VQTFQAFNFLQGQSVQKKQRFFKDKIMDDKMINYFVVHLFVFWVAACPRWAALETKNVS